MKFKHLLLFLCCFPLVSIAQDQETESKNFSLGFTLSPNISWLSGSPGSFISGGAGIGYSYGVLADIGFAKNYYFSTAFTLTTLNSSGERIEYSFDKYHLQYLDIPISLKLKSNAESNPRFYGQFGFGTGIRVSAKGETKLYGSSTYSPKENISDNVNLFRLGLLAGAGTEWNISRNLTVLTGVNFNNPFVRTFDTGSDVKNPYFTLQLGVFF